MRERASGGRGERGRERARAERGRASRRPFRAAPRDAPRTRRLARARARRLRRGAVRRRGRVGGTGWRCVCASKPPPAHKQARPLRRGAAARAARKGGIRAGGASSVPRASRRGAARRGGGRARRRTSRAAAPPSKCSCASPTSRPNTSSNCAASRAITSGNKWRGCDRLVHRRAAAREISSTRTLSMTRRSEAPFAPPRPPPRAPRLASAPAPPPPPFASTPSTRPLSPRLSHLAAAAQQQQRRQQRRQRRRRRHTAAAQQQRQRSGSAAAAQRQRAAAGGGSAAAAARTHTAARRRHTQQQQRRRRQQQRRRRRRQRQQRLKDDGAARAAGRSHFAASQRRVAASSALRRCAEAAERREWLAALGPSPPSCARRARRGAEVRVPFREHGALRGGAPRGGPPSVRGVRASVWCARVPPSLRPSAPRRATRPARAPLAAHAHPRRARSQLCGVRQRGEVRRRADRRGGGAAGREARRGGGRVRLRLRPPVQRRRRPFGRPCRGGRRCAQTSSARRGSAPRVPRHCLRAGHQAGGRGTLGVAPPQQASLAAPQPPTNRGAVARRPLHPRRPTWRALASGRWRAAGAEGRPEGERLADQPPSTPWTSRRWLSRLQRRR